MEKENKFLQLDREVLKKLLKDHSTGHNIMWCTDNYNSYGKMYERKRSIDVELISVIKPRVYKSRQAQIQRVRDKAEVFTPSWICNAQNNLIDEFWFGRKDVFNTESDKSWISRTDKIDFSDTEGHRWTDYVKLNRLEITCGEAPYITSRYDTVTGDYIEVKDRIGFLDRKLRIISENTNNIEEKWLEWSLEAVKSIYGFEYQGDSLFIARVNILLDIMEYFEHMFNKEMDISFVMEISDIISWNVWQMDGLKFVVPGSCTEEKTVSDRGFLFEELFVEEQVCGCSGCLKGDNTKHNGIYCKIMDWKTHKSERYMDLIK